MRQVTAAVIIERGRLLLARRPPGDPLEGLWELPGGKLEPGETPQDCLERELLEEMAMVATAGEILAVTEYHYDHGSFEMMAISAERQSGFKLLVHDASVWVCRMDLSDYPLAPADIVLIEELRGLQAWS